MSDFFLFIIFLLHWNRNWESIRISIGKQNRIGNAIDKIQIIPNPSYILSIKKNKVSI